MSVEKPVIKYPGSKWSIADWIISIMPPHKSYLEPFFGSGAVFFKKPPAKIETINDLDGDVVNLFRVIRDQSEQLERAVALTPVSREEYDKAWARLRSDEELDPVERARITLVGYWMAVGSHPAYWSGWRRDVAGREAAYCVRNWIRLPQWIEDSVERIREAQIENRPAVDLIRQFASPDVLIYADPPYVLSTRSQKQYRKEMDNTQHEELLKALLSHPGTVMLSGYDNELYNDMLTGWTKLHQKAQADKGKPRTETLWLNYEPQISLF